MANEKPTNPAPHDDALAAPHGMGDEAPGSEGAGHEDSQEHGEEAAGAAAAETEPSPSASGFVGMLSKSSPPLEDLSPARPDMPKPQPSRATPQPVSEPKEEQSEGSYEIQMAREIKMPEMSARAGGAARPTARRGRKIPGWYHTAVPVMFTLGALLMCIGVWAVGAVVAIVANFDSFPLLAHATDVYGYPITDDAGRAVWSNASKVMAVAMLVAVPVAISLVVMAVVIRRQIARSEQAAARQG